MATPTCCPATTTGSPRPRAARCSARGNWVFLWKGGWAAAGSTPATCRWPAARRRSSSTWWRSWTPRPPSPPVRWPSGGSGSRSSCGASSAAPSTTRCSAPGPGVAAGWPSSGNSHGAGATATSTSPAPASCTPSAAWPPWPGRSCSDPASASSPRTASPRALPGHHIPMALLGTFILLFGWFGFNAASTFASSDPQFATVAVNTAIAAAFGSTICMFWVWRRSGKPDPAMMANGMLAGLVAITAPCAFVDPWAAMVHRQRRRRARGRVGVLLGAAGSDRRPGRGHLRPRRVRDLRRALRRHLRQREVRHRRRRCRHRVERHHDVARRRRRGRRRHRDPLRRQRPGPARWPRSSGSSSSGP